MTLVPNANQAWKMLSVKIPAASAALAAAWLSVPDEIRAMVPAHWVAIISGVLSVLSIAGRLIDQGLSK